MQPRLGVHVLPRRAQLRERDPHSAFRQEPGPVSQSVVREFGLRFNARGLVADREECRSPGQGPVRALPFKFNQFQLHILSSRDRFLVILRDSVGPIRACEFSAIF